ncbi:methyltransferase domain-containing protein [Dokdonia sinensis]|uniref:Methyltransferase domain-containing protein n=1 Tax=Dokdonia sinensis TaxID=2479847 RepID=A0A3M0G6D0_9FLAO|nr:methyltransferase domain-containing protein [Dokdonia sinensis]RMB60475.1 methyltransferase domain-containing protein [Dokdonia sinensis]
MDLVELSSYKTTRHPWETARLHIIKEFISSLPSNVDQILDVGSGDAFLANNLSAINDSCDVHCVDIEYNEALMSTIHEQFKNDRLHLYSALSLVSRKDFDLVTLLDVIEHVPDDRAFLKEIISQEYVKAGTHFIVTVPAFQSLFAQHDLLLKHYRRYNRKTLQKSLEDSGLSIISSGYFFSSLIPPRIVQLLTEKLKKKEEADLKNLGNWNHGKLFTSLVRNVLVADYAFAKALKKLGVHLPGLSCYAICKLK